MIVSGSGSEMVITVYVDPTPPRLCEVPACGKPHRSRGLCVKHYNKVYAETHKEEKVAYDKAYNEAHKEEHAPRMKAYREAHKEEISVWQKSYREAHKEERAARMKGEIAVLSNRAGQARRKARKLSNVAEAYEYLDIFVRDDWTCQVCFYPIDPELKYPNPGFGTIDHVVPLVLGGSDTEDNVTAAHLVCNQRKGASLPVILPLNVVPFVTEFTPDLPILTIEARYIEEERTG